MQAYDLTYIGIGLTTGEGVGVARYDGKTITLDDRTDESSNNNTNYAIDAKGNRTQVTGHWDWDNFSETWYAEPIAAGKPIWKIVATNIPTGTFVSASASRPIYDSQNRLLGMIAVDIHLLKLGDFLPNLDISQSGQVFIIDRDGTLIANSGKEKPFTIANEKIQRLRAIDSPDAIVHTIAKHLQTSNRFQSSAQKTDFQLDVQGKRNFIHIVPWRDKYGLDWLVVTSVPIVCVLILPTV